MCLMVWCPESKYQSEVLGDLPDRPRSEKVDLIMCWAILGVEYWKAMGAWLSQSWKSLHLWWHDRLYYHNFVVTRGIQRWCVQGLCNNCKKNSCTELFMSIFFATETLCFAYFLSFCLGSISNIMNIRWYSLLFYRELGDATLLLWGTVQDILSKT